MLDLTLLRVASNRTLKVNKCNTTTNGSNLHECVALYDTVCPVEFEEDEEDEEEDRGLEVGRRRKLHAVYNVHEETGR